MRCFGVKSINHEKLSAVWFIASEVMFLYAIVGRVIYVVGVPFPFINKGVNPMTLLAISGLLLLSGIACVLCGIYKNIKGAL